jgi:uncharacterized protein YjbK
MHEEHIVMSHKTAATVAHTIGIDTGKNTLQTEKRTSRGRNQDRARVAGGQDYEVRYEAKKSHSSKAAVKKAVKKVGNSRKRVEQRLGR